MAKKTILMEDPDFRKKALNYAQLLLSGRKVTEKITYAGFDFEVAYPLPSDLRKIDQRIAVYCNNQSYRSYTPKALYSFEVYATLDVVVINAPTWWKDMKSSDQCPFDELIMHLYRRWLRFYKTLRIYLTPSVLNSSNGGPDGTPSTGSAVEDVGDNAFSDITYRSEDSES